MLSSLAAARKKSIDVSYWKLWERRAGGLRLDSMYQIQSGGGFARNFYNRMLLFQLVYFILLSLQYLKIIVGRISPAAGQPVKIDSSSPAVYELAIFTSGLERSQFFFNSKSLHNFSRSIRADDLR